LIETGPLNFPPAASCIFPSYHPDVAKNNSNSSLRSGESSFLSESGELSLFEAWLFAE